MKFLINPKSFDLGNQAHVGILQLLCSLEFAIFSSKWYIDTAEEEFSPPKTEQLIALAFTIACLGETLHKFENFSVKGYLQKSKLWSEEQKRAWDFLQSEKVRKLKSKVLKTIRDKSAFHIDPEPVKTRMQKLSAETQLIDIWETDRFFKTGHSNLALDIIANSLFEASLQNEHIVKLTAEVMGALREIILAVINDIDKLKVQK